MVATSTRQPRAKYDCVCGQKVSRGSEKSHEAGGKHQEWLRIDHSVGGDMTTSTAPAPEPEPTISDEFQPEPPTTGSGSTDYKTPWDSEIQTLLDSPQSPVNKAKGLRRIFSYRDWPDAAHPMTVREILIQAGIPIHEGLESSDAAGVQKLRAAWEKENK